MRTFSKQLSDLSDYALEISGIKNKYTEEDIMNASLVFFEVFSSLMYDHHNGKLNQEQMEMLFTEAGKSIHQTIKLFTGIDTKEYLKDKKETE